MDKKSGFFLSEIGGRWERRMETRESSGKMRG